jgi:alcohol dehydrogenase class IV
VGLFLPYTIEYAARESPRRYSEISRYLGFPVESESAGADSLVDVVRDLLRRVGQPVSLNEAGIERDAITDRMEKLVENAANEATTVVHPRVASMEELERLFLYAWEGRRVDF